LGLEHSASHVRPLRLAQPNLYAWIRAQFAEEGLHPYDFSATTVHSTDGAGSNLVIHFGENPVQAREHSMPVGEDYESDTKLVTFVKETVSLCRQSVMKEYLESIKGRSSV